MSLTNFPNGITSFGVPVLGTIGGLPFTGDYYFVDPVNGADGNEGSVELPLKTLYGALAKCTAGNNDVVVLIGNGAASGSARLSTALAQEIDSTATTGTLNWNKDATHLIGVCAPTAVAQRARIAPPSGTYTAATFNATSFINVTASGCYFANVSVFCGFSTGNASMIAWTDSGSRNAYSNVNIYGMADAASAGGANARTLKLDGGGEHTFINCTWVAILSLEVPRMQRLSLLVVRLVTRLWTAFSRSKRLRVRLWACWLRRLLRLTVGPSSKGAPSSITLPRPPPRCLLLPRFLLRQAVC
jgi:hypothetical protein